MTQGNLAVRSGGCVFCHNPMTDLLDTGYSQKLHANFHFSCLHSQDASENTAKIIKQEYQITD